TCPGQRDVEQGVGETANGFTLLGGLALEEGDVTHRVSAFVSREIGRIDGASAGRLTAVSLHQSAVAVEAHERAIGACAQSLADEAGRQRVERLGDLREVIAPDLWIAPVRHLVELTGRRQEVRLLLGVEALKRQAARAGVATHAVLLSTPAFGEIARFCDRAQRLAGEAVIAHVRYGTLDTSLVAGLPNSGWIDDEAARLRVLEERLVDQRMERVGVLDDRFGVIRQQHAEHAAEELPRLLAGLNRALCRLLEARPYEAVTREDGGEDPRSKASSLAERVRLQIPHPSG